MSSLVFLMAKKKLLSAFFISFVTFCVSFCVYVITLFSLKNSGNLPSTFFTAFKRKIISLSFFSFFYFVLSFSFSSFEKLSSFTGKNAEHLVFFEVCSQDILSMAVLFICYFVGFITLLTFSDQIWSKNLEIPIIILYFQTICYVLVSTDNLLILFLAYELILLPSIYIVLKGSYSEKSIQALIYFFIWTHIGSFFILISIVYIYITKNSLSYVELSSITFLSNEKTILYLLFFLGFGVKVPVWPLQYWLLKIHVEAPTPFSIFLSGFLVKIGVFCFYSSTYFLKDIEFSYIGASLCIFGMLESSLKMWGQDDLKKIVANATVLDMNFTYLLFLFDDNKFLWIGVMSMLGHALLSSYMFFLVECIYRRTGSRSVSKLSGLDNYYPNLVKSIWGMLFLFLGFPGTLKFYAEIRALSYFSFVGSTPVTIAIFFMVVFGGVCLAKSWLLVSYGQYVPKQNKVKNNIYMDLTKYEIMIFLMLFLFSFLGCFLNIYVTLIFGIF